MITRALHGAACAALVASACAAGSQPLVPPAGPVLRDQQSAEFALRLRQQQQAAELERLRPGDVQLRQEMDSLHLQQRQRLEALDASQRLGLGLQPSGAVPSGAAPPAARLQQERATVLDHADRELADQVRRAAQEKAQGDPPRWGPTL